MIRLKQLREEHGWNMKEAAQQIGLSYTTYVSYERGDREPNSEMLIRLAQFYGCTIDYLLFKSDIPAEVGNYDRPASDNDLKFALFGGDGEITDEMFDEVKAFAEFVKQKNLNKKKRD